MFLERLAVRLFRLIAYVALQLFRALFHACTHCTSLVSAARVTAYISLIQGSFFLKQNEGNQEKPGCLTLSPYILLDRCPPPRGMKCASRMVMFTHAAARVSIFWPCNWISTARQIHRVTYACTDSPPLALRGARQTAKSLKIPLTTATHTCLPATRPKLLGRDAAILDSATGWGGDRTVLSIHTLVSI